MKMHLSCVHVACAALVTLALTAAAPSDVAPHHIARRSFYDLQCKGVYNAAIFNRLDRICDDCYNLFRESQVYTLCRDECFTSQFFKGCVEVLQENDQIETFKQYIKQLHGADPI